MPQLADFMETFLATMSFLVNIDGYCLLVNNKLIPSDFISNTYTIEIDNVSASIMKLQINLTKFMYVPSARSSSALFKRSATHYPSRPYCGEQGRATQYMAVLPCSLLSRGLGNSVSALRSCAVRACNVTCVQLLGADRAVVASYCPTTARKVG